MAVEAALGLAHGPARPICTASAPAAAAQWWQNARTLLPLSCSLDFLIYDADELDL